jgi:hypothetical protein
MDFTINLTPNSFFIAGEANIIFKYQLAEFAVKKVLETPEKRICISLLDVSLDSVLEAIKKLDYEQLKIYMKEVCYTLPAVYITVPDPQNFKWGSPKDLTASIQAYLSGTNLSFKLTFNIPNWGEKTITLPDLLPWG